MSAGLMRTKMSSPPATRANASLRQPDRDGRGVLALLMDIPSREEPRSLIAVFIGVISRD
jgi:hypothetical protein